MRALDLSDHLTIQVAKSAFAETRQPSSPHFLLADLHGRSLHFAPTSTLRPDPTYLAWHPRLLAEDYLTFTRFSLTTCQYRWYWASSLARQL